MPRSENRRRPSLPLSPRMLALVAGAAIALVALVVAVPIAAVDAAGVYSRYHELAQPSENLATSSHKDLACADCHGGGVLPVLRELAVAGDFYLGLVGNRQEALFARFPSPENAACLSCHETEWSMESSRTAKVPHPAHQRVASETRSCVKCHKWTAHEETYMQKHKTMPFSGVCASYGCHVGTKQTDECETCHHTLAKGDWKKEHPGVALQTGSNGCLEVCHEIDQCRGCHTTGKQPKVAGVPVQSGVQAIQTAHVRPDWTEKHGAVAGADPSQCMKCHVSDGECRQCHARRPSFHGSLESWIGTHKDVAPKNRNDRRCISACHEKPWCEECHKQFKEMR